MAKFVKVQDLNGVTAFLNVDRIINVTVNNWGMERPHTPRVTIVYDEGGSIGKLEYIPNTDPDFDRNPRSARRGIEQFIKELEDR